MKLKTFKELNDAGIFDLMPNGFNLYDDETNKQFKYVELAGNGLYTVNGDTIYPQQVDDFEVTCIGSDPKGELEVPAVWVKIV